MKAGKPTLAFISPLFLFPNDAGGKIRTTNILRGLKGGAFNVVLAMPAAAGQVAAWQAELDGVCDELVTWSPPVSRPRWQRAFDLLGSLPVNIINDRTAPSLAAVQGLCQRSDIDLFVFDFVHAAVLRPDGLRARSVCFTHNVEAEIFDRHAQRASSFWWRAIWRQQYKKMRRFEHTALQRFDTVIAVSERDAQAFQSIYGLPNTRAIPTGVDLDFFAYRDPPAVDADHPATVVFTGSMDWAANVEGMQFFLNEVWPLVLARMPEARLKVVGRNPPASLQALARGIDNVHFTGFVDDVRPHVQDAHAFIIPLTVGGGTRIKAFEAMAMGCPVISTAIGIEGLEAQADTDFLQRDEPTALADAVLSVLTDEALRCKLARNARHLVESRFGHRVASTVFERICLDSLGEGEAAARSADQTGVRPATA